MVDVIRVIYKVILKFKDTDGKVYKKGDIYFSEDKERIETLSTKNNKYKKIFIVKIEEKQEAVEENNNDEAVHEDEGIHVNEMTAKQLREALDQLGVEYKKNDKKDKLIGLLEEAKDSTSEEGD